MSTEHLANPKSEFARQVIKAVICGETLNGRQGVARKIFDEVYESYKDSMNKDESEMLCLEAIAALEKPSFANIRTICHHYHKNALRQRPRLCTNKYEVIRGIYKPPEQFAGVDLWDLIEALNDQNPDYGKYLKMLYYRYSKKEIRQALNISGNRQFYEFRDRVVDAIRNLTGEE